jgi:hypothetical protein
MKIGKRIEIIYLKEGWEGSQPDTKIAFAFAFRRWYFTCWLKIKPSFFRHFICGVHLEGVRWMFGISK